MLNLSVNKYMISLSAYLFFVKLSSAKDWPFLIFVIHLLASKLLFLMPRLSWHSIILYPTGKEKALIVGATSPGRGCRHATVIALLTLWGLNKEPGKAVISQHYALLVGCITLMVMKKIWAFIICYLIVYLEQLIFMPDKGQISKLNLLPWCPIAYATFSL